MNSDLSEVAERRPLDAHLLAHALVIHALLLSTTLKLVNMRIKSVSCRHLQPELEVVVGPLHALGQSLQLVAAVLLYLSVKVKSASGDGLALIQALSRVSLFYATQHEFLSSGTVIGGHMR